MRLVDIQRVASFWASLVLGLEVSFYLGTLVAGEQVASVHPATYPFSSLRCLFFVVGVERLVGRQTVSRCTLVYIPLYSTVVQLWSKKYSQTQAETHNIGFDEQIRLRRTIPSTIN